LSEIVQFDFTVFCDISSIGIWAIKYVNIHMPFNIIPFQIILFYWVLRCLSSVIQLNCQNKVLNRIVDLVFYINYTLKT